TGHSECAIPPSQGSVLTSLAETEVRAQTLMYPRLCGRPMVLVERANPTDRLDIERLIAAYLTSEGVKPRPERITWAVEQVMKNRVGGLILVGREKKTVVGVALAVYSPSAEL